MKNVIVLLIIMIGILEAKDNIVKIGEAKIVLNYPNNFVAVKGKSKDLDNLSNYMVPPQNQLLQFYLTKDDYTKNKKNLVNSDMREYILVQTFKKFVNKKLSNKDFKGMADYIKNNQKELSVIPHHFPHLIQTHTA